MAWEFLVESCYGNCGAVSHHVQPNALRPMNAKTVGFRDRHMKCRIKIRIASLVSHYKPRPLLPTPHYDTLPSLPSESQKRNALKIRLGWLTGETNKNESNECRIGISKWSGRQWSGYITMYLSNPNLPSTTAILKYQGSFFEWLRSKLQYTTYTPQMDLLLKVMHDWDQLQWKMATSSRKYFQRLSKNKVCASF